MSESGDSSVDSIEYALGGTVDAKRRLEIQDAQFGHVSEDLLDKLQIRPADRVVEVGTGPGGLSKRIMQRLGSEGVLVAVDYTKSLLDQAREHVANVGEGQFQPVVADIRELGPWLEGANVVVGRTVLHHLPLVETWLGELQRVLSPGTRVGFIEPEFRAPLTRIASFETELRQEIETLQTWAEGIIRYYTMRDLSPGIGATMELAMRMAGYSNLTYAWNEAPADASTIENMLLFYEEVRQKYCSLGIMTNEQIDEQKRRVAAFPVKGLPSVWGTHSVTAVV